AVIIVLTRNIGCPVIKRRRSSEYSSATRKPNASVGLHRIRARSDYSSATRKCKPHNAVAQWRCTRGVITLVKFNTLMSDRTYRWQFTACGSSGCRPTNWACDRSQRPDRSCGEEACHRDSDEYDERDSREVAFDARVQQSPNHNRNRRLAESH